MILNWPGATGDQMQHDRRFLHGGHRVLRDATKAPLKCKGWKDRLDHIREEEFWMTPETPSLRLAGRIEVLRKVLSQPFSATGRSSSLLPAKRVRSQFLSLRHFVVANSALVAIDPEKTLGFKGIWRGPVYP